MTLIEKLILLNTNIILLITVWNVDKIRRQIEVKKKR